jgi:signal transduction histidine kinase
MKNLLNFARPPKPQFMVADVNKILDTVIKMLNFSLKPSSSTPEPSKPIDILKDFDEHLPVIMADPMQLQQVALNLLLNAVDAMPDGGTIGVKTSHNSLTHSIQIEVSDTGEGIDKEVFDKIFQPFFTTKAKGTGLGLSISKRLVEEHVGNITVESNSGRGTTFRITLPVKQEGVMVA